MKIKHSVSSPPYKVWGNLFREKALLKETNLFWSNLWGMFYMGANGQIIQAGKLMVKRFQRSSRVRFALIDPDLGY